MPQALTTDAGPSLRPRTRVVFVEADAAAARVATCAAATAGGEIVASLDPRSAAVGGATRDAEVAVIDLPGREALPLIDAFVARGLLVIATSGAGSVSLAVEAMRRGAADFVLKPYTPEALARRLEPRFAEIQARTHARAARPASMQVDPGADFASFVGSSPVMRALYAEIERIAPSRAPVFVTGESGSGKELCAEAIHALSGRAKKPFVALNCGAIPRELMESEVFGHVRGAFTGASEDRAGAFEAAEGGTLFLDEIGEMELALQAKLLRVLQTGEFRRVGEPRARRADVRIVCATHRDPRAEVGAGRFRQDLFYRLHVLPIRLPALRERPGDVARLAEAFLVRFAAEEGRGFRGFAPEATERLLAYSWPGNVRELQNVVRRAVVLGEGEEVTPDMLPLEILGGPPARPLGDLPSEGGISIEPFWITERRVIENAVAAFGGNTARAAAALEISPSTIYRKRERWAELDGEA
ncbi:sigma-54-dependent transcriptional regulator [Hansschlegelia zhihuaiae]|uniref:Sigma-54-dependent Fis family transcriptional regulator n=1 Tax=Hansschlegelia zhihuaiae TaxID=405005 RepID=A0A4Q0MKH2_9HYPH|nr:sigma-54 dependent transcriptional regulator [Hansschlegelia zhihuaiae]RXF74104.1 sigma-54-dependent Fis family transcriptional regulator [Hansschlegelia zhihuaiae]